jgi:hypothetical protein
MWVMRGNTSVKNKKMMMIVVVMVVMMIQPIGAMPGNTVSMTEHHIHDDHLHDDHPDGPRRRIQLRGTCGVRFSLSRAVRPTCRHSACASSAAERIWVAWSGQLGGQIQFDDRVRK